MSRQAKSKQLPDLVYLDECLSYNHESGIFTWNTRPESHFKSKAMQDLWNNKVSGKVAGSKSSTGHLVIKLDGVLYKLHRIAYKIYYKKEPDNFIDHVNGIKDDNRIINLREATHQQNLQNRPKLSNNKTGLKGVSYKKSNNKYVAQISINCVTKHIGIFDNKDDAYLAYCNASIENHNNFSNIN